MHLLETPQLWAFDQFGWFFSHDVLDIRHLILFFFLFLYFDLPALILLITNLILYMSIILLPVPDLLRVIILYKLYNGRYFLNPDLLSNISTIFPVDGMGKNSNFAT